MTADVTLLLKFLFKVVFPHGGTYLAIEAVINYKAYQLFGRQEIENVMDNGMKKKQVYLFCSNP